MEKVIEQLACTAFIVAIIVYAIAKYFLQKKVQIKILSTLKPGEHKICDFRLFLWLECCVAGVTGYFLVRNIGLLLMPNLQPFGYLTHDNALLFFFIQSIPLIIMCILFASLKTICTNIRIIHLSAFSIFQHIFLAKKNTHSFQDVASCKEVDSFPGKGLWIEYKDGKKDIIASIANYDELKNEIIKYMEKSKMEGLTNE